MEKLPQEIADRISWELEYEDLKNILLLSRQFQRAAECTSKAFKIVELDSSPASIKQFLSIYGGYRIHYLRKISFRTRFPDIKTGESSVRVRDGSDCRYNLDDLRQMNEQFTEQINCLFSALKTLESYAGATGGSKNIKLVIYAPIRSVGNACLHRTYVSWRVQLLSPDNLPGVGLIRSLKFKNGTDIDPMLDWNKVALGGGGLVRSMKKPPGQKTKPEPGWNQSVCISKLDLRVIIDIAKKFPNLEELSCRLGLDCWPSNLRDEIARHFTHGWEGPGRDTRRDFTRVLPTLKLPYLKTLDLNFIDPLSPAQNIDQRKAIPDLISPDQHDPLSRNLRIFSSHLRHMTIRGTFDETLFWPTDGAEAIPSWPSLQFLNVMLHIGTPSGKWYFKGDQWDKGATSGREITSSHYPPLTSGRIDRKRDRQIDHYRIMNKKHGGLSWDEPYIRATQYRVIPNDEVLYPVLHAFARAATYSMPSLLHAEIYFPLKLNATDIERLYKRYERRAQQYHRPEFLSHNLHNMTWGFNWQAAGFGMYEFPKRRLYYNVTEWRPDEELRDALLNIGKGRRGQDEYVVQERFLHYL